MWNYFLKHSLLECVASVGPFCPHCILRPPYHVRCVSLQLLCQEPKSLVDDAGITLKNHLEFRDPCIFSWLSLAQDSGTDLLQRSSWTRNMHKIVCAFKWEKPHLDSAVVFLFLRLVAQSLAESAQVAFCWIHIPDTQFHFSQSILTCQFHVQASCYVDLLATSVEPQHFPPFGAPSSPEEASSAVGSLGSLLCHVNFGHVDVLTIYFFNQKQVNRVFHFVDTCCVDSLIQMSKRPGAHLFLTFCIADTRNWPSSACLS